MEKFETFYRFKEKGYEFVLEPANDVLQLKITKRPHNLEKQDDINIRLLYKVICDTFNVLPKEACEAIQYKCCVFQRGGSEIEFYREVARKTNI